MTDKRYNTLIARVKGKMPADISDWVGDNVVFTDGENDCYASAIYTQGKKWVVIIRTAIFRLRKAYQEATLAHEIGHTYAGHTKAIPSKKVEAIEESQADDLARKWGFDIDGFNEWASRVG